MMEYMHKLYADNPTATAVLIGLVVAWIVLTAADVVVKLIGPDDSKSQ